MWSDYLNWCGNKRKNMPTAEIITIGTELLLGETVDTNTHYIARTLRDIGIDLYRASTVGDNTARIAGIIRESLTRADILITTGGLGPTIDDPTREAVALGTGVETEFRPELWEQINKDITDLDDQMRNGEFSTLLEWLRKNIHRHGAKFEPQEMVQRITGTKIDPVPYTNYLQTKFGEIYGL